MAGYSFEMMDSHLFHLLFSGFMAQDRKKVFVYVSQFEDTRNPHSI